MEHPFSAFYPILNILQTLRTCVPGLGLKLSYDIINALSGEIKLESKEYEGTEFTILLQT